jgi:hypothetical protein
MMTVFSLRLPDELKEAAAAQASEAGVSLNQYIAVALAARVGVQAEAERYCLAVPGPLPAAQRRFWRAPVSGMSRAMMTRSRVGN